jgi:CHAD domain-containing protein
MGGDRFCSRLIPVARRWNSFFPVDSAITIKTGYCNCSNLISLKEMVAVNFILKHWKKEQTVFLQNLEGLRKQNKGETINLVHDLRVATKKLRSYLKLLSLLLNKKDYKALFEKTEQLFSVLGKHRDIEMGLEGVAAFEKGNKISYEAFSNYLKAVQQQEWAWVQSALDDYDEKELPALTATVEEDLKNKSNDELLKKLKSIVEKELNKARRLSAHLDQQPHLIRKLFKDIFYWASLLPNEILAPGQLKSIKKSLEYLGNWQDLEMLHRKIKHFRKDFVPDTKEDNRQLKELKKTIIAKKQRILDRAAENIHIALSH